MPLCKTCLSIPFFSLPVFPDWLIGHAIVVGLINYIDNGKAKGRKLGQPHHQSHEALRASADACAMCRLIERSLSTVTKIYETKASGSSAKYLNPVGPPSGQLYICERSGGLNGFVVLSPGTHKEVYMVAAAAFCVDGDSSLATRYPGRRVDPNPLSQTTLSRAHSWIRDCESNHGHESLTHVNLPTRLIDVKDPSLDANKVRLAEVQGQRGSYLALSHCWGTGRGLTTTKKTLGRRKAGINLRDLPQTFEDAVYITRELGHRYIWIDSLCIIQDDEADWRRESAKMAEVYSKAYLTIAAALAHEDIQGFLSARPVRQYIPLTYPGKGVVYAFSIPFLQDSAEGYSYTRMFEEPLVKRGWTLQERYLASRTLHFGTTQLSFECEEHFLTEDGYANTQLVHYLGPPSGPTISKKWHDVIDAYGKRRLTYSKDKLIALAGLARVFEERCTHESSKQQYLAGLWRDNLVKYMCWSVGGHGTPVSPYRAPTWSWASLEGSISSMPLNGWEEIAKIEDAGVDLAGENPYGEVKGGWVRIRTARMSLKRKPGDEVMAFMLLDGKLRDMCYVFWDCKLEFEGKDIDAMELSALGMVWTKGSTNTAVLLIVCEKQRDGRSVYERLGIIQASNSEVADEYKRRHEQGKTEVMVLV